MSNAKEVLEARRRELENDIARRTRETRASDSEEVKDYTDRVTDDEMVAETLEEATRETTELEQVDDALKRVADGTYGKCIVCGKPIEAARLKAIPWTPYCLEDQEKRDR